GFQPRSAQRDGHLRSARHRSRPGSSRYREAGPVCRTRAAAGRPRCAGGLLRPLSAGCPLMSGLDEILPHTGSLIRRAQQRHAAEWARLVSNTITSVQFAALAILADTPGASQRELGDALEVD